MRGCLPRCVINKPGTSDGYIFNYPKHMAVCLDNPKLMRCKDKESEGLISLY